VFSIRKKMLQSGSKPRQKLKATTVTRFWIVLTIVSTSWLLAAAAGVPASMPQNQGRNVRIEFDNRLRSRVVACFDTKETVMGPFTASETVTTADPLIGFLLTSQKHEHLKDAVGGGERLTVEGKAGTLTK
jgi:alpha-galactosidase